MEIATIAKSANPPGQRTLPLLVHFESDVQGRITLPGVQRYRRVSFENLTGLGLGETEHIVLLSLESTLRDNLPELRRPNVRVIAFSHERFKDPRLDGAVYAYAPPNIPNALLERLVDNALDHIHLIATRQDAHEKLAGATREINELNHIGAALSAEHDTEKLLETILTKSREITQSDAGSLYLVEAVESDRRAEELAEERYLGTGREGVDPSPVDPLGGAAESGVKLTAAHRDLGGKRLRFKLAQNDSVAVPFREITMEISNKSIAGYVALTGDIVSIEDAYHLPDGVPYSINRKFDEDSGYRTKSILAVPMRNQKDEIVGVLQLINAKRTFSMHLDSVSTIMTEVIPFSERQEEIVASLASQAAVALENSRLYESIQRLFEGFVRASVTAIEARDPTTSGHSFRVANLTVALAESADRTDTGPYAHIRFTRTEMKEIRYASLLHDFGKVAVREEVLVKAKKLYPNQLELIKQRFHLVKRSVQAETLQARLDYLLEKGRDEYMARTAEFDAKMQLQLAELDRDFEIILKSNEPTVIPEGNFDRLLSIAALPFIDFDDREATLLNPDEVTLLSIRKGSLNDAERLQIESHVVHTFSFLQQIPWTREIRNIPEIARGHHEKLNGKGYPYNLSAPEIPIQTRMMTISDIFDALSAADRPYKKAVSLDRALDILGYAVDDGELDPNLFRLFMDAKVYEKWKIEPYPY